ncbi:gamma-glutamyl-gamma-aminobutyrate hydrolase [Duganella sp. Leaf126]|uniref:gamma-glutamyl-gamma-aminobutyrate hydrolase family protein n=1 Tax=Duganella sp. Leaf126 TaxID=1736266 RepID=UPI0006F2568D|nr:gamma-glutamyl-gamma-aminobutyrate hydrolase family protein [Duganella sp. Leaf126]KQQ47488.1 gamma-glutamyl-gamma-aminobutyrate hydrolase [Duganella sp. Leaf126]
MCSPIVLVSACVSQAGAHAAHFAQCKYVAAVADGARCAPLIVPALGAATDFAALLDLADGILLTGSPSNVAPARYGQVPHDAALPGDAARDATTLPLIDAAIARGIPLLAICRGLQEVNVALGGTLHQAVHAVAGMRDHRERKDDALAQQYGPAHRVLPAPDGVLARVLGSAEPLMVNSLHGQGIDRLAPRLAVEARADDGLVEAFRVRDARGFTLAVQWHPEWQAMENPVSIKLLQAFGDACRAYKQSRNTVTSGEM